MVGGDRVGRCGSYGPLFMEIGEISVSIMKRQYASLGVSEFDLASMIEMGSVFFISLLSSPFFSFATALPELCWSCICYSYISPLLWLLNGR